MQAQASNCGGKGQPCCSAGDAASTGLHSVLCPSGYGTGVEQELICDTDLEEPTCIACGKVNQPCCKFTFSSTTSSCDDGTACKSGMCKVCGDLNQTCCSDGPPSDKDVRSSLCPAGYGTEVEQELMCDIDLEEPACIMCGKVNQPCCKFTFSSTTSSCDDGTACKSGMCKVCGDVNQTCCSDGPPSDKDVRSSLCPAGYGTEVEQELMCDIDLEEPACIACGKVNQPCCKFSSSSTTSSCDDGTACKSGVCEVCGVLGQPCCQGGTAPPCSAGATCGEEGVCGGCGRLGEPCCSESGDLLAQCVYAGVSLLLDHPSAAS